MDARVKKWASFTIRWGIAVIGIAWVLNNTSFHDRLLIIDPTTHRPTEVRVLGDARDSDQTFQIVDRHNPDAAARTISHDDVWTRADRSKIKIVTPSGGEQPVKLLAIHPAPSTDKSLPPTELCVEDPVSHRISLISPAEVEGGYKVAVPYPLVDIGLIRLVHSAQPFFLLLALLVLPISYIITSLRWHMLLETLEIHIGRWRTFVLNMVGAFYNTFMPGSTGGDLVKAYYASLHTTHRVRAIISVVVDRVLGLLALVILGGVMSCLQLQVAECRRVAFISALALGGTAVGLFVFYHPFWKRATGLDFLLKRLPLQRQINNAVEAMHLYGRRPAVPIWATVMTFPVHVTTIISAYLAGRAFGLPLPFWYFWVITPVIVLVGAIPISPQGAGVMEFFAIALTRNQGVTISQAFALAMSIRVGAMFWNLMAGIFVLRGGYHAPDKSERREMEKDEDGESIDPEGEKKRSTPADWNASPSPVHQASSISAPA